MLAAPARRARFRTSGSAGIPRPGSSSASSTPCCGARWRGNPKLFLRCVDQGILERAADDPAFIVGLPSTVLADFDRLAWLTRPASQLRSTSSRRSRRLFLRGVRTPRERPALFGRPRILAGDHCKTGERPVPAVRRGGPAVSPGLFHPAHRPQRAAVPEYPPIDPRSRRSRSRRNAEGQEIRVSARSGPRGGRRASGRPPSAACRCCCSTPTWPRTTPRTARSRKICTAATSLRIQQEIVLGVGGVRALRAPA